MQLPFPNHNGLYNYNKDMINSQLAMYSMPLSELEDKIEDDMKLLPEYRIYQIDEPYITRNK